MTKESTSWFAIEAKKDGFPVLLKVRRVSPNSAFKKLFVVTWAYKEDHASRLPSPAFYAILEHFEQVVVEEVERKNLGVFVASETGMGTSKYFFYTHAVEALSSELDQGIQSDQSVEFAADDDPGWSEYSRFLDMTKSQGL